MPRTKKSAAAVDGASEMQSRDRILEAAMRLFADRGFDATSTKAVAVEAHVPSSLLFYHFATKEALLEEIFKGEGVFAVLDETLKVVWEEPPQIGLKTAGIRLFHWLRDHEAKARIFFKEITSHRELSARLRELRRRSVGRVISYLDRAVERGQLAPTNTKLIAQAFVSTILLGILFDRETNANVFVRDLTALLIGDRREHQT